MINLAEKLELFFAYPEEIIFNQDRSSNMLILRQGKVGFATKLAGSDHNETIVNEVKVKEEGQPRLLSFDYIFHRIINYEIKSLGYSFLSQIDYSVFKEIIKERKYDYEHYCQILDKCQNILDFYEFIECDVCKTKHSKMRCPKLHYIPIRQHVINKFILSDKTSSNKRRKGVRCLKQRFNVLRAFHELDMDNDNYNPVI